VISFYASGIPKAQPRPRAFARRMGAKFVARVYESGTAEGWKGEIALAARAHTPAAPLTGPLRLDVDFFLPRPQSLMRKKDPDGPIPHTAKPDRDNLDKAVMDCLKSLGFFVDDAQVCAGEPRKFYAAKGATPGARIVLRTIGAEKE
jgi:Holliday junction resolvase RusA-like endonuclease